MHTIAGEFSLIRRLTQECHNYKETSWNGGVYKNELLLYKTKPKHMKNKQMEQTENSKVGNIAASCVD